MSNTISKSINLINETSRGILLTLDKEKQIHSRPIGAYGNEGLDLYFVSKKNTKKAEHIKQNSTVTFYIEKPGEQPEDFRYLSVTGDARLIEEENEIENAKKIISRKYSRLNDLLSNGESNEWGVYGINSRSLKYYERTEVGPVEVIENL